MTASADTLRQAAKRHGRGHPGEQWVTCTLADLVGLLTGAHPDNTASSEDGAA